MRLKPVPWDQITRHLSLSCEEDQVFVRATSVSGGDIADAYRLDCRGAHYFVKLQSRQYLSMFECEYRSLQAIAKSLATQHSASIEACPRPICVGSTDSHAFLIMRFIEFGSLRQEADLGRLLARLHQVKNDIEQFGWFEDNFIGLTKQYNSWTNNWADFFWRQRINTQLDLALSKHAGDRLLPLRTNLRQRIYSILKHHTPDACLVHGDLWSGNKAYAKSGKAYIFDPAAYYGDAETDLALTELFGGFDGEFYRAYYAEHPKREGYERRRDIYQLYHMLNHFNLFGTAYLDSCMRLIHRICDGDFKT